MLKYVSPLYLAVIFILFCIYDVPGYAESVTAKPVALYSVLLIGAVMAFLGLLIHIAGKRWTAEGRYRIVDDDIPAYPVQPLEDRG
jgi:hypothetical protein